MELPSYIYQPLKGQQEVRVLELKPNRARIEIHILHVNVSRECFQALSYVWGDPNQSHRAFVLDQHESELGSIPLTKNLYDALRDLRDTNNLGSRIFWIDQISINQQDALEKGLQVSMMSQIYSQAKRVVTYLGPAESPEYEQKGMQLLEKIYKNIPDTTWNHFYEAGGILDCWKRVLNGSIQLKPLSSDIEVPSTDLTKDQVAEKLMELGWDWLVRVAYGEWAQRLWIMQEQMLNQETTALRGHHLTDWDDVATIPVLFGVGYLPRLYVETIRMTMGENLLPSAIIEESLYGTWWERRARFTSDHYTGSPLIENIDWYSRLLCGNPRDRMYAVLAVSQDTKDLALTPDYNSAVGHLIQEFSVRALTQASDLRLLSYASIWRQPSSKLPSWCFMFNIPRDFGPRPFTTAFNVYAAHPLTSINQPARFASNGSVLIVRGQAIDTVCVARRTIAASLQVSSAVNKGAEMEQLNKLLESNSLLDGGNSPTFITSLLHILQEDLCLAELSSVFYAVFARGPWSLAPSEYMNSDEATAYLLWIYLRNWCCWFQSKFRETPECLEHAVANMGRYYLPLKGTGEKSLLFEKGEEATIQQLLPFALEEGRLLGRTRAGRLYNSMRGIEEGDVIMALQGADQLHVMRLRGDMYKLIGDIYVEGLMYGEAYAGQDPHQVDYKIRIC